MPKEIQARNMAFQIQFLVVAILSITASSTNVGKKGEMTMDPLTAKDVAASFEEALQEEAPLLKEEEELRAEDVRGKALLRTHLRPSKIKLLEPSEPLTLSPESGEESSDFEKDVTDLVLGLSHGGMMATPFGESVTKINNLITKDMMPKVENAHAVDQKELDKLFADISLCKTVENGGMAVAISHRTSYDGLSASHQSCRAVEGTLYDENVDCHKRWKNAKEDKELKCAAYLEKSTIYGESSNNQEIMKKAAAEDVQTYLTRFTETVCGMPVDCQCPGDAGGGGGDGGRGGGFLDDFLKHKKECEDATSFFNTLTIQCKEADFAWHEKRKECDLIQDGMDDASCKWAIEMKEVCWNYENCYKPTRGAYETVMHQKKQEETDRKAEWRGLSRMHCLITAFADFKVEHSEIDWCKTAFHNTTHLDLVFPTIPAHLNCTYKNWFPNTADYKEKEFAPLPVVARGKLDANECVSLAEISTIAAPGSGWQCKCEILTLVGLWNANSLVKCTGDCKDVYRTTEDNSCPLGTKIFSPQSSQDWATLINSNVPALRDPNWIIDVTRVWPGCVDCTQGPIMTYEAQSKSESMSQRWMTFDGSPWWLRSVKHVYPGALEYSANCYLDLPETMPGNETDVTFKADKCEYHSKSYYCQPIQQSLTPKAGSPDGCTCKRLEVNGVYSANILIKCEKCLDVYKSTQTNSCPEGTKLFSPRTRDDWRSFLASAGPLRSPHWIIDVTRPQNGCGGCTNFAMNSAEAAQATWITSDGSPWWLRSTTYSQPNGDGTELHGDYTANCYLNLWGRPAGANTVTFDDGKCDYHSRSYYCQSLKTTTTTTTTTTTFTVSETEVIGLGRGVLFNYPVQKLLDAGWLLSYDEPYKDYTPSSALTTPDERADGMPPVAECACVLWGSKDPANETRLSLAAFGRLDKIKDQAKVSENGVWWYTVEGKAAGFSKTDHWNLDNADKADDEPDSRLSWHITGSDGGYRSGATLGLDTDETWRKIVMFARMVNNTCEVPAL